MRQLLAVLALWGFAPTVPRESGLEVVASNAGFQPSVVRLHKGEPARLVLKTADVEHCFAVEELRIEKRILPGRATTLELTPDRAGSFVIHCCLEPDAPAMKGKILVVE